MADKKVTELSAITNLSGDDLLLVVNDPSGTPTSNKVTVTNLFANVVPAVVHKGTVTNRANTNIFGTRLQITANTIFSGSATFNGDLDVDSVIVNSTTIIGSNGKLHANNAIGGGAIKSSMIESVDDYMQVANTTLLVDDRMQVANTRALLAIETANTDLKIAALGASINAEFSTIIDVTVSNTVYSNNFIAVNSLQASNTLVITTQKSDPSTSNAVNEGWDAGSIFYSNTYLYIATDENTIKRIALEEF